MPSISHQIERTLAFKLSKYANQLKKYRIKIDVKKEGNIAAWSDKEVVKEEMRLVATVGIMTSAYLPLTTKTIDVFATYEVNDLAPFASISSKTQTVQALANDLSNVVAMLILSFIGK